MKKIHFVGIALLLVSFIACSPRIFSQTSIAKEQLENVVRANSKPLKTQLETTPDKPNQITSKTNDSYVKRRMEELEKALLEKTKQDIINKLQIEKTINKGIYSEKDNSNKTTIVSFDEKKVNDEANEILNRKVVLENFGISFFDNNKFDNTNLSAGSAPSSYLLGPGDQLKVIVWSDLGDETVYDIRVNPENQVYIPILGVIGVAGMTVEEFKMIALGKLSDKFKHFKGQVTLNKIRTIQIYVVGEVENPGAMVISGLATAFDALYKAGGPTDRGSMRNIKVLKDSGKTSEIDLYKYFLKGDRSQDVSLSNGDTIFVSTYKSKVKVQGMVVRPAIYEINENTSLKNILDMAGNAMASANSGIVKITRWIDGKRRKVFDIILNDENKVQSFKIHNGDEIEVVKGIETIGNKVNIEGAVAKPGIYAIDENTYVKDLIENAGGIVKEEATLKYGSIYRKTTEGKETIISFIPKWALINENKNNIKLEPFDKVKIYTNEEVNADIRTVNIEGAIRRPGEYVFREGMRLSDVIYKAKGLSIDASGDAEVARISDKGATKILKLNAKSAANSLGSTDDILLRPLDRISILASGDKRVTPEIVVIKGQVKRPGPYALKHKGEKLSSIIKRAGGLCVDAFPEGAVFMRKMVHISNYKQLETAKNVQKEMFKQASLDLQADLLRAGAQLPTSSAGAAQNTANSSELVGEQIMDMTDREELTSENKAAKQETSEFGGIRMQARGILGKLVRIPIPLAEILSGKADKYDDVALLDGDQITLPIIPRAVSIFGAVVNPTTILFKQNRNARYYINRCGGFSSHSNHRKTVVIRASGEVFAMRHIKKINRGDIILVPPKAKLVRPNKLKEFGEITKIIGNLAIGYEVINR